MEIEMSIGCAIYHAIMRPSEGRARLALVELREKFQAGSFRVIRRANTALDDDGSDQATRADHSGGRWASGPTSR
jgi:hypothetical protein